MSRLQAFTDDTPQNIQIDGFCEKPSPQSDIPMPGLALRRGDEEGEVRELYAGDPRELVSIDAARRNHVRNQRLHIRRRAKTCESIIAGWDGNHMKALARQRGAECCADGRLILCNDDKRTFGAA